MVTESKDQTIDDEFEMCVFCSTELDRSDEPSVTMKTIVLSNAGHRFPAHMGCYWDHARDAYKDAMARRDAAEPDYELEREERQYEAFLDAQSAPPEGI